MVNSGIRIKREAASCLNNISNGSWQWLLSIIPPPYRLHVVSVYSRYRLALSLLNDFSYLFIMLWCVLTHILYQQPDIESLPDGGSVCCDPAMNFSSSCRVNFPPSLSPQTTYYYFMLLSFSSVFHPGLSFTSQYIYFFHFSPRCSGFISLFRAGETILHARLELKELSSFQTNTEADVLVRIFVFEHEIFRILV